MRAKQLIRKRNDSNSIWSDISDDDLVDGHKGFRRGLSRFAFLVSALLALVLLSYVAYGVYGLQTREPNATKIVELAMDSVVLVECSNPENDYTSFGSGVVMDIDSPGIYESAIMSAAHVFDDCSEGTEVKVVHKGVTYSGELSKKDPLVANDDINTYTADLALIYIEEKLPALAPADQAEIGDWAIVIGNPLDLTNYVTFGIISSVSDSEYGTDAPINHGNSGGPVLNSRGEVLGIVSSGAIEVDAIDENEEGIWDNAAGISTIKRLKLSCPLIFSNAPTCPFSN